MYGIIGKITAQTAQFNVMICGKEKYIADFESVCMKHVTSYLKMLLPNSDVSCIFSAIYYICSVCRVIFIT